jgi:hypothetical protein
MQFELGTITPEEELRSRAESIVHGCQTRRLGRLQIAMLKKMGANRSLLGGHYGALYRDRRTLDRLIARDLVWSQPPIYRSDAWWLGMHSYGLTTLGHEVAKLLEKDPFA